MPAISFRGHTLSIRDDYNGTAVFDLTTNHGGYAATNITKDAAREVVATLTEIFDLNAPVDNQFTVDLFWDSDTFEQSQRGFAVGRHASHREAAEQRFYDLGSPGLYDRMVVHGNGESKEYKISKTTTVELVDA